MNPTGLCGLELVEFATPDPVYLEKLFSEFGFTKTHRHCTLKAVAYQQNNIIFLLNTDPNSFAAAFAKIHGPSICSMGWVFENPQAALDCALKAGAKKGARTDYSVPAIEGIGGSLLYFLKPKQALQSLGFEPIANITPQPQKGFQRIDHLTHNVYYGTMKEWADFYRNIFGFTEVRYFDIRGQKTGLQSFALRSPCKTFSIPINEATEKKSQINEFLQRYDGPGIQHLALATSDILDSLDKLEGTGIKMLDIIPSYYDTVFDRVPKVTEDRKRIQRHQVLVDGDENGYLLQIFTKDLIGPIFFEIIQRKNHHSFGEGNFQALFDSIERDQARRGVL